MVSRGPAPEVDRDVRLRRHRPADRVDEANLLPRVVEALPGEHEGEDLERLAQPGRASGRRPRVEPEPVQLLLDRPPPEPQLEAAAAHDVDRRGHLGQHRRVAERVAGDEVTDPDPGRARRDRGGERPTLVGVSVDRARRGEVVHEPHRVEPGPLGGEDPLQDHVERHRDLGEEQAELHGAGG